MRRGLTLVEVLVAIVVLSIGVVALTATSAAVARAVSTNKARSLRDLERRDSLEIARSLEN
jgi:prepilin-type N-terminal cleavage/methylation domain-containing protein